MVQRSLQTFLSKGPPHKKSESESMAQQVHTDVSGLVWKVLVKPGDQVKSGDVLFILEVMKTEVPYEADMDGEVTAVHITEDSGMVQEDTLANEIS